ncbi:MAG: response regulator [Desulfovibrio sp.]|nr:response regulator [Desulfovibrio sp.]MBI4958715.1 response regulator [Desulfovibrio sp.]
MSLTREDVPVKKAPSARGMRFPLAFKILAPTLTISLLGSLLLFLWLHQVLVQKDEEDLQERMQTFLSTQVEQLSDPVWTFDQENIERLIRSYEPTSDLLQATLYDTEGNILAQVRGISANNFERTFTAVKHITRKAGGATFELGRLEVVFHDGRLREAASSRLVAELKTLVLLLSLLIGACALVVHFQIGVPLARLKKSLERNALPEGNEPLAWSSNDEIGDVVASYNSMLQEVDGKTRHLKLAAKVIENALEGVLITDQNGSILQVNPSFTAITGYSPEEVIGKNPRILGSGRQSPEFYQEMWKKISQEGSWAGEIWNKRKNGDIFPEWMTISALANPSGSITHYVSVFHDITESKQAEDELRTAKESAEIASKAKTEFLANMSHEIRTPLNGILGMLQLMQTTTTDYEQDEYISTAIKTTNRLSGLLTDILDLSKIESNKLSVHESTFNFLELQQSVQELFTTAAAEKGLDLIFTIDDNTPNHLIGDEARLRQVLFNLVGNAIKFTEKGSITVNISMMSKPDDTPVRVLFSVRDTGIGIPSDRLQEIFEPFTQVDRSYVRRHEGAGLGLAIVRRIVSLLSGELSIDSAEGQGTTVRAVFPLKTPATGRTRRPSGKSPKLSKTERGLQILLVEDEAINRITMARMLEKSGYAVATASNGHEGLQLAAKHSFDIILMDIQMPEMDGIEATGRIRSGKAEGVDPAVPIIALTAYAMSGDRERFLEAGMDSYVSKPVELEVLKQVMESVLRERGKL